MAPPPVHDSAVLLRFHGCPAFLHRHFPPRCPPSHPTLRSQQQPSSWDCSTIPKLQLPDTATSRVCMAVARTGLTLPQISCFTLSFTCFSSDSDSCPSVVIGPLLQFPHPPRAGPFLLTLLVFPLVPSPNGVLRGSLYIFSTDHVFLSALSWCSACTSGSEGVFLMYLWREMYSMSTYSSAILFSSFCLSNFICIISF